MSTQKTQIEMAKRFSGKTALVTGSSRGIGAGIARRLAAEGARVAVTYSSNPESAQKVVDSLPGSGHFCLQLHVGDETSVEKAFSEVIEKFSQLDYLVNNAGITKDQLLLRMKAEDFDKVLETNLRGVFLCTRAAAKVMLKAKTGAIVNITSVIGQTGNPGQANYAASKGGVEAFTKSVALELASRQIRVNCVAPGFIATEMTGVLNDQQKQAILDRVPLRAMGDVDDIAGCVSFLLSSESKYITGHTLSVNGGLYM
ncbi:MAG: 3-oxoacyl-[acyl-carrier-protein] reductase [Bdellovibrionaceae bacterium]|nr:3-oxoacyl-[acyl-carrier-protein] reductase [Pseudobdellovibrionaceae bacterium]